MFTAVIAQEALRRAGLRVTPQRMMIIEVLVGNRAHPTVEDVYAQVREQYPSISLATVYHTLSMLAQQGLVLELHGGKAGLRCDPNTHPHAHAYCDTCGKVTDIAFPDLPEWHPSAIEGFQSRNVEISFYGLCADCRHTVEASSPAAQC